MEPVTCEAFATYVNAGLRGSRFMGACEVGTADGTVWVTGHRMPTWLVWIRASAYVVFVPWIPILMVAMIVTYNQEPGWQGILAAAIVGFLYVAAALGIGDVWAARKAPVETVRWQATDASPVKQHYDRTASATGLADTALVRLAGGKSVAELRVPVGPRGQRRLLALRADVELRERLAWILRGGQYA